MPIKDEVFKLFPIIEHYWEDSKRKTVNFRIPLNNYKPLDIDELFFLKQKFLINSITEQLCIHFFKGVSHRKVFEIEDMI